MEQTTTTYQLQGYHGGSWHDIPGARGDRERVEADLAVYRGVSLGWEDYRIMPIEDEEPLVDRKWYWVERERLTGDNETTPAMYRSDVDCFCSYQFAGVPRRHLKVLREVK